MSDKIDYLISPTGETIKIELIRQAVADLAEAARPVVESMSHYGAALIAFISELIENNPYLAALARQARQHPRGLVHPASRVGRQRRH